MLKRDCITEDGSACGWFGICHKVGKAMCDIRGTSKKDIINKRLAFAKNSLNTEQKKVIEMITNNRNKNEK